MVVDKSHPREKICVESTVKPDGAVTEPPVGEDVVDDPAFCFFDMEVTDSMNADGTKQKLGMRFIGTEVIRVEPGGYCHDQGILKDDEIWSVGGIRFVGLETGEKLKVLSQARPFKVTFKRPLYCDGYFEVNLTEDQLGMKYGCLSDGSWVVCALTPGGWGERNGICEGDEIQEFDGKLLRTLLSQEVLDLIGSTNRPCPVEIKRPHPAHFDLSIVNELREQFDEPAIEFNTDARDRTDYTLPHLREKLAALEAAKASGSEGAEKRESTYVKVPSPKASPRPNTSPRPDKNLTEKDDAVADVADVKGESTTTAGEEDNSNKLNASVAKTPAVVPDVLAKKADPVAENFFSVEDVKMDLDENVKQQGLFAGFFSCCQVVKVTDAEAVKMSSIPK